MLTVTHLLLKPVAMGLQHACMKITHIYTHCVRSVNVIYEALASLRQFACWSTHHAKQPYTSASRHELKKLLLPQQGCIRGLRGKMLLRKQ